MADIATKLLPCPFCGGIPELSNLVDDDDYFIRCTNCEVQQIANYKPYDAARRWNSRNGSGINAPKIVDNDKDEITAMLDGEELRGWSYANDAERCQKMQMAHEFAEGWFEARIHVKIAA